MFHAEPRRGCYRCASPNEGFQAYYLTDHRFYAGIRALLEQALQTPIRPACAHIGSYSAPKIQTYGRRAYAPDEGQRRQQF